MNQYVYVSLSLIGLCGIVGAGVAIGSGCAPGLPALLLPLSLSSPLPALFCPAERHPTPPLVLPCSVGMMAMQAAELEKQEVKVVAHSPMEKVSLDKGFAAQGARN